jgi:hypothetical protein
MLPLSCHSYLCHPQLFRHVDHSVGLLEAASRIASDRQAQQCEEEEGGVAFERGGEGGGSEQGNKGPKATSQQEVGHTFPP